MLCENKNTVPRASQPQQAVCGSVRGFSTLTVYCLGWTLHQPPRKRGSMRQLCCFDTWLPGRSLRGDGIPERWRQCPITHLALFLWYVPASGWCVVDPLDALPQECWSRTGHLQPNRSDCEKRAPEVRVFDWQQLCVLMVYTICWSVPCYTLSLYILSGNIFQKFSALYWLPTCFCLGLPAI